MLISKKPLTWNGLVSIVFGLETDAEFCSNIFKYVFDQTYKNTEYIFVYPAEFDIESFKEKINEKTEIDITTPVKYIQSNKRVDLMDEGIAATSGEVVFLKYSQPIIWYPNHILSHLRQHQLKKFKNSFCLSHVEIKGIEDSPENPYTTINYRMTKKITPQNIFLDEISFTKDVDISFSRYKSYINKDAKLVDPSSPEAIEVFDPAKLLQEVVTKIGSIQFADELTLVTLIQSKPQQAIQQPNWPNDQIFQVVDDNLDVRMCIPTIFGNSQLDQMWNNKIRGYIKEQWEDIKTRKNQKIIVKRTVGMGDVIQTSGLMSYLKKEFPEAELWYVTSKTRSCQDILTTFEAKPKVVIGIEEHFILTDMLGYNNLPKLLEENNLPKDTIFDLRIDLDLAYESRMALPFAKAYYDVLGLDLNAPENIYTPQLDIEKYINEKEIKPMVDYEYISCCLGGSGWPGKELNIDEVKKILTMLKEKGYKLFHVSSLMENPDPTRNYRSLADMFEWVNTEDNFEQMVSAIYYSKSYIGADNGPMHLADSCGKKKFVWSGAALTKMTLGKEENPIDLTVLSHNELSCLGCKHKMFYNMIQNPEDPKTINLNFVPQCTNPDHFACMKNFGDEKIKEKVETFIS